MNHMLETATHKSISIAFRSSGGWEPLFGTFGSTSDTSSPHVTNTSPPPFEVPGVVAFHAAAAGEASYCAAWVTACAAKISILLAPWRKDTLILN